jgi:hypothetical protein
VATTQDYDDTKFVYVCWLIWENPYYLLSLSFDDFHVIRHLLSGFSGDLQLQFDHQLPVISSRHPKARS